VNPGNFHPDRSADFDLTTKLKTMVNVNYLRFERTAPMSSCFSNRPFTTQFGVDTSLGFQYRPPLSENIVILGGALRSVGAARAEQAARGRSLRPGGVPGIVTSRVDSAPSLPRPFPLPVPPPLAGEVRWGPGAGEGRGGAVPPEGPPCRAAAARRTGPQCRAPDDLAGIHHGDAACGFGDHVHVVLTRMRAMPRSRWRYGATPKICAGP